MRKLLSYVLTLSAAIVGLTGCLKDEDFEDQKYGIQIKEVKAVAFPQSSSSPLVVGINAISTPQTVDGPFITLEEDGKPTSPVTATLQINQALVPLADPSFVALGPTQFSINSLNVTFAAGQIISDAIKITIPNASVLDPLKAYAIGLTISSVDQGYKVAANQKNVVVSFSIKNIYDGVYEITGEALRAGDPVLSGFFGPYERELTTSGPFSIQWQGQVLWANTGSSALPAGYEPNVTINPANNAVTSVTSPNGAIYATNPVVNTAIVGATQRYDAPNKTIYFEFSYGAGPTSRLFSFKAKYLRPR